MFQTADYLKVTGEDESSLSAIKNPVALDRPAADSYGVLLPPIFD
jgi:hypothetical protein